MSIYCIYCGQEKELGHSPECPIIIGTPKCVWGQYSTEGYDSEFDLHLGRMKFLLTFRNGKIGPSDKKIGYRLDYEALAFIIRRNRATLRQCRGKIDKLSNSWWDKRKKKRINDKIHKIQNELSITRDWAETSAIQWGLEIAQVTKAYNSLLESDIVADFIFNGKSSLNLDSYIPIFRDDATGILYYCEVKVRKC